MALPMDQVAGSFRSSRIRESAVLKLVLSVTGLGVALATFSANDSEPHTVAPAF